MSHMFSSSSRVSVAPDVLFRVVGDESVLLNLKTEMYLGLDSVGTRIWHVLTDSPSLEDAYATLLGEYEVEPGRLREDLHEFVQELLAQGLLEIHS
jgi:hypothetical protein